MILVYENYILAHRIGISGEFSRAGKLYLAPPMLDESRAVTQYFFLFLLLYTLCKHNYDNSIDDFHKK